MVVRTAAISSDGSSSTQRDGREASEYVHARPCTFETDDPLNPLNWSTSKKLWVTAQALPFALMTVFNIGWYSAASADLRNTMSDSPSGLEMQLGNALFVWAIAIFPLVLAPFSECVVQPSFVIAYRPTDAPLPAQSLRPQMVLSEQHHRLWTCVYLSSVSSQSCSASRRSDGHWSSRCCREHIGEIIDCQK
jgi:hypothetical protein